MLENEQIRLLPADPSMARALTDYVRRNRDFHRATDPVHPEEYYTEEVQRQLIEAEVERREQKRGYRFYIEPVAEPGKIIGSIGLNEVVWGAFRSCFLGYKLDQDYLNRGYMTQAVALLTDYAFTELKLHRIEANVMPRNKQSLRVLEKNGFIHEGISHKYLNINGVWEDHVHMVKLGPDENR